MLQFFRLFSDKKFIFNGHCYPWHLDLVLLNATSDLLIALAYFFISLLLIYLLHQRSEIPFKGVFGLFCAFLVACGITHFMAVWALWHPTYWLAAMVKALTAGVSCYTVAKMVQLLPQALALPNATQLEATNQTLAKQIKNQQQTEAQLPESTEPPSLLIQQERQKAGGRGHKERVSAQLPVCLLATEREQGFQAPSETTLALDAVQDAFESPCEWNLLPSLQSTGNKRTGQFFYPPPPLLPSSGITPLAKDVTEQQLAQKALQQSNNQLEISVEAQTEQLKQAVAQLQAEIEQRQQVEAALREREEQYRSVVDNVREVIFQTDAQGYWLFLNPAWSEITGFAIADSLGTLFLDYIHPDDRQRNLELFQPLIEREKEYCRHEVRYLTHDGSYRWIEVFAQLTCDQNGTITGTCGTLYDITERKQAEEALYQREHYLAVLVEVQRQLLAFKDDNQSEPPNPTLFAEILPLLGQVSGASRVYVFENHNDANGHLLMSQRAEWCTLGTHPEFDNPMLQNVAYADFFPRWANVLSQGEIIAGVVAEFPESERIVLELQGVLSILVLPLIVNGQFFGFIGFDNCTEVRPWQASEVDLLRAAAAAVSLWCERFLAQQALRHSEARWRKQHRALSKLAQYPSIYNGHLRMALQEITRVVAHTLNVERCSVWLYNEDCSSLHCADLYELTTSSHSAFYQLNRLDYPNYFSALETNQVIAASDAHADSRTQEFSASYLVPLDITSMLDVPIRLGGITVGVLCVEHTGSRRQWAWEEQNFASTAAYLASLAMEANHRAVTEKALRESEERFRSLVAHIPGAVYRCTYTTYWAMEFISDVIEEISGFPATDFLHRQDQTFLSLIAPQDLTRVEQARQTCIAQKQPYLLEYRIITKDGSVKWVYEKGQGVFATDGSLLWLDGIIFDITSIKRIEEELRSSEEQFRQLTENIREVFFLATPDLNQILYISPAYEEVWGRTPQSLCEQPQTWLDSIHPKDRSRVEAALTRHLLLTQEFQEEYRIVRPGGSVRWVWVRGFQVRNSAGQVTRIAGIAEDITEDKRAQAEILNALLKEKELNDLKSRFVSITSHEFRTPLATIMSTTELLEYYDWTKDEEREQLHLIQTAVKQMLDLLEDLLFIGKADSGKLRFNPELVDLREFCQELVAEIERSMSLKTAPVLKQRQFEEYQVTGNGESETVPFVLAVPPLSSCTISFASSGEIALAYMDKKLLRQLLSNLLVNAIKYSPHGGTIQFALTCQGDEAVFQIQDQGIGIPKDDQAHVFEFFHRGRNVGTISGTGLGLAIVKKCVDLHGGQITLHSDVGVGTQFTVTLPLNHQHYSSQEQGLQSLPNEIPDS